MWPFDSDTNQAMAGPAPQQQPMAPYGFGSPMTPWQDPEFRRQATFDAITNAGLGLIQSSGPSPVPINMATSFGNLMGGAAQGMQGSYERYMQRMMAARQMQQMQMQMQMYPAAMDALKNGGSYDPWGGQGAPQGAGMPTAPATQQTAQDESGNNPQAVNPTSGAWGKYQFLPSTYASLVQKHPDLGLPFNMKSMSSEQQDLAKNTLDTDNAKDLTALGIQPTPASLYLAHRLGSGGAAKLLAAPDDSQISSLFPPSWIQQNPDLRTTVGQFKASVAQRYGGAPGGQTAQAAPSGTPQGAPGLPPPPKPPNLNRYAAIAMIPGMGPYAQTMMKNDVMRFEQANKLYEMSVANDPRYAAAKAAAVARAETGPKVEQQAALIPGKAAEAQAVESAKRAGEAEGHDLYVLGGKGWQNKTPEDLRKTASPEAVSIADQVQSGLIKLEDVQGMTRSGGIPITKNDITALGAKLYGKEWDPRMAGLRNDWMKNATTGDTSKLIGSFNTVYQHLDQVLDLYKGIQNGDSDAINKARAWLYARTGKSEYTNVEAMGHALGTEMARIIKNGPLNEGEVTSAVEQLEAARPPKQFFGALETLRHAIDARWASNVSGPAARVKAPKEWVDSLIVPEAKAARDRFDANQQEFAGKQAAQGAPANRPPLSSFHRAPQ